MITLLWAVLAVIVLIVLAIGLWFLKAIVQGALEGWRSGSEEPDGSDESDGPYELPEECAAIGLLPPDRQNTDSASPVPAELTAALDAVARGEWKPAAALLGRTAAERDWENRSSYAFDLGEKAAQDDTWLLAWETARPDDPDAAVVRARSTVCLAWDIRGGKRAQYTTGEQFRGFHATLQRSRAETERAAGLNPEDPTPYITEIWTALGLGYPHAEMDRIWAAITERAPYHYEAHFSAVQYWCQKWRGSHELARAFAAEAAAKAPLGSLLTAFPLIVHFEHDETTDQEVDRTPEMVALVDAALADVAAADPAHPRLAEVRHLLAYYLSLQDRDEAAVEQFRLVDGYVGALPWRYRADPAAEYCSLRDQSVRAAPVTA
ncbi:hypothetical protein [Streptomyces californicus]